MNNTTFAKLDSVLAAIREWQRGAIAWGEALRRADLTNEGNAVLTERVNRTTSENDLALIVAGLKL